MKPDLDAGMRYQTGSRFKMLIGGEWSDGSADPLRVKAAPEGLRLCNTQLGFDLRIGQTYLICLSKWREGAYPFVPRSGQYSIYWLKRSGTFSSASDNVKIRAFADQANGFWKLIKTIEALSSPVDAVKP